MEMNTQSHIVPRKLYRVYVYPLLCVVTACDEETFALLLFIFLQSSKKGRPIMLSSRDVHEGTSCPFEAIPQKNTLEQLTKI